MLFFDLNVPSRSYLHHALPLSILAADAKYRYPFYDYNIQTFFPDSMLPRSRSERVAGLNKFILCPALNNWQWQALGFLTVRYENSYAIGARDKATLFSQINEWLRCGYYIETRLNEFFMPERPAFYAKLHTLHINMIIGQEPDGTLQIAGYGDDYTISAVPQERFEQAFFQFSTTGNWKLMDSIPYHRALWLWRPLPSPIHAQCTLELISAQLSDYLKQGNSRSHRIVATDDKYAYPDEPGRWGLGTYESWREYLDLVEQRGSNLDLRATRTLWEHKSCMLQRAHLLEDSGIQFKPRVIDTLKRIEELSRQFRLLSYGYRRGAGPSCIASMRECLKTIEPIERDSFAEMLQNIN